MDVETLPNETAPLEEVFLKNGIQVQEDAASFAAVNAYQCSCGATEVILWIKSGHEYEWVFRLGDTFPVRTQTWKVDRVDNPGQENWSIRLARVA